MPEPKRRVDHLVHAVHDLEAAADFYRRLGFQVGARNRHPWGTENRLVQFRSSFLELITVGDRAEVIPPHEPGRFSFGAFVRDYLREREGLAMLALDSADARVDAARFAQAGIGGFEPFFFERKGRRPDGGEAQVAFTLAFAVDPGLPSAAFFVCQQHFPESFWNPTFQQHPNGAIDIRAVTIAAPEPEAHADFLSAFAGSAAGQSTDGGLAVPLRDSARLTVSRAARVAGLTSFMVEVSDPGNRAGILSRTAIPAEASGHRMAVRPVDAYGVEIAMAVAPSKGGRLSV